VHTRARAHTVTDGGEVRRGALGTIDALSALGPHAVVSGGRNGVVIARSFRMPFRLALKAFGTQEYRLPNKRGTVTMARWDKPDSASGAAPPRDTQRAPRNVRHATCDMQRATCNVHLGTCDMQRATHRRATRTTCDAQRTTCSAHRATMRVHRCLSPVLPLRASFLLTSATTPTSTGLATPVPMYPGVPNCTLLPVSTEDYSTLHHPCMRECRCTGPGVPEYSTTRRYPSVSETIVPDLTWVL
jgi:hypothetical protein